MLQLVLKKHPRQKTLIHTGNKMRNTEQANALGTDPEKLSKCSFGAVAVPVASCTSQAIWQTFDRSSRQRHPYSTFLCALALQRDRFHWSSHKLLTTRNLIGGGAGFFTSEPKFTSSSLFQFALSEAVDFAFSHDLFRFTSSGSAAANCSK